MAICLSLSFKKLKNSTFIYSDKFNLQHILIILKTNFEWCYGVS